VQANAGQLATSTQALTINLAAMTRTLAVPHVKRTHGVRVSPQALLTHMPQGVAIYTSRRARHRPHQPGGRTAVLDLTRVDSTAQSLCPKATAIQL